MPGTRRRPPPRRRASLAPSVATVLQALAGRPPTTAGELRAITGLPRRTLSGALRVLRESGRLREQQSLRDSRKTFFWLAPGPAPEHLGVLPAPA